MTDRYRPSPRGPTATAGRRRRRRCVGALLAGTLALFAVIAPAVAGDFEDGYRAYRNGDYATALKLLHPLAEAGHVRAQTTLGHMYSTGHGVPQSDLLAAEWLRKAALQGDAAAQFNLGHMYIRGAGVPVDIEQAIRWFRLAAAQGDVDAQNNLGFIYGNGWGVPADYVEAYVWWSRAADRDRPEATQARDEIAKRMTPADLARAKAILAEARPKAAPVVALAPRPTAGKPPPKPAAVKPPPAPKSVAARQDAGFRLQFGYFSSSANAESTVDDLKRSHRELSRSAGVEVVQNVTKDSQTFYRVVSAPFASKHAAIETCTRFKNEKVDCFVIADE